MPHTVLLAEDDRAIRHALERALTLEGYEVTAVADGLEALAQAHRRPPDVLVLDVMMPGIDGLQVCRVLRAEGDRTPILMLTARVATADRVAGLDAGADDYVVKPFDVDEVFARLRALLRRTDLPVGVPEEQQPMPGAPLAVAGLRIDPPARRVWRGEREIELTLRQRLAGATPGQVLGMVGVESLVLTATGVFFGTAAGFAGIIPFTAVRTDSLLPDEGPGTWLAIVAIATAATFVTSLATARRTLRTPAVGAVTPVA
ncbi:response regulator transcription factor [Streptomyces sp. NPDC048825]|uniref:response regulator transcription factor n=1 Tax=Streptomyces sp. NPDC048825 TaxID=3365592 RepID=UPI00371E072C